jgi:hypothetical protein
MRKLEQHLMFLSMPFLYNQNLVKADCAVTNKLIKRITKKIFVKKTTSKINIGNSRPFDNTVRQENFAVQRNRT